jgi:hypothetical protein
MTAPTADAIEDRRRLRQVRRLVERQKRGQSVNLAEAMEVCVYRSLLGPPGILSPETEPAVCVALLGGEAEGFCEEMRADLLAVLRRGGVVMLAASSPTLRDYGKAELMLAMAPVRGVA